MHDEKTLQIMGDLKKQESVSADCCSSLAVVIWFFFRSFANHII